MADETPKAPKAPRKPKATPAVAPETAAPVAPEAVSTDNVDSLGEPKDTSVALGPRGDENVVHIPAGFKPEPTAKSIPNTVTDKVDSAGNEIAEEHVYVPGPRGLGAKHPDSFKL